MSPYEVKKILKAYAEKHHLQVYRLSISAREPGVVVVHGWPSMQGQGIEAAGGMANIWAKFAKFADGHGVRLRKAGDAY